MDYDARKRKDIDLLTRNNIFSFIGIYNTQIYKELLLSSVSKFISELTESELELIFTTNNIDSIPLNKRTVFFNIQNYISNKLNAIFISLWRDSFTLGINHSIGDIVSDILPKDTSFNSILSSNVSAIADFAMSREERNRRRRDKRIKVRADKAKREAATLKRNRNALDNYNTGRNLERQYAKKTALIAAKQRESYLRSIVDIRNNYKRGESTKKNYLSSFYMRQRQRVLSLDYARKYDINVKKEIRDYLKEDISSIKSIRALPLDITELTKRIQQHISGRNIVNRINSKSPSARHIVRTELVLAYNFGKLAGHTHPDDIDRLVRWNANWEVAGKIPGYEICQYCKDMHGKEFTVRQLLEIGVMTDIGIMDYKGRAKTSFKNPSLPMIPGHPNCGCFWQILSIKEERQASKNLFQTLVDNAVPVALVGAGIVGGGFLLSRSNAFKQFVRSAFGNADDILKNVGQASRTGIDDIASDIPFIAQPEKFVSSVSRRRAAERAAKAGQVSTGVDVNIPSVTTQSPSISTSTSIVPPVSTVQNQTPNINIPVPNQTDLNDVENIVSQAVDPDTARQYINIVNQVIEPNT